MKKIILLLTFLCVIVGCVSAKEPSTNYRNALIFAYSPVNSVYEDDNIKLEIFNEQLWAVNKTKKTIFIDLSQCFLVNNGSSFPMLVNQQDEKKASTIGVTTSIGEFITVAPATGSKQNDTFICNMSSRIYGKYSSVETPSQNFSDYEKRLLTIIEDLLSESLSADPKGKKYIGTATRHLTEDESISNLGVSIAYAFNKQSEDWTTVAISTWVSDIIFAPFYVEMPKDLKDKEKRGFGIKETDPVKIHIKAESPFEFDSDKSPIIVADWEGDYNKGEFLLNVTRISKTKKANPFLAGLATILTGGAAADLLFQPIDEVFYKSINIFDGVDANWGKMKYAKEILNTSHKSN